MNNLVNDRKYIDILLERYGYDKVVNFVNSLNEGFDDSFDDDTDDWSDAMATADDSIIINNIEKNAKAYREIWLSPEGQRQSKWWFTRLPDWPSGYRYIMDLDFSHHSRIVVERGANKNGQMWWQCSYTVDEKKVDSFTLPFPCTETEYVKNIQRFKDKYINDSDFFVKEFTTLWDAKGEVFKVEEKDKERMRGCLAKKNYSAAAKIGDKRKAVARFVAGYRVEFPNNNMREDMEVYRQFYHISSSDYSVFAFLHKAKDLNATLGDILSTFDAMMGASGNVESADKIEQISTSRCLPGGFFVWLTKNNIPYNIANEGSQWGRSWKAGKEQTCTLILFPGDSKETEIEFIKSPTTPTYTIGYTKGPIKVSNTGRSSTNYFYTYMKFADLKKQILDQI